MNKLTRMPAYSTTPLHGTTVSTEPTRPIPERPLVSPVLKHLRSPSVVSSSTSAASQPEKSVRENRGLFSRSDAALSHAQTTNVIKRPCYAPDPIRANAGDESVVDLRVKKDITRRFFRNSDEYKVIRYENPCEVIASNKAGEEASLWSEGARFAVPKKLGGREGEKEGKEGDVYQLSAYHVRKKPKTDLYGGEPISEAVLERENNEQLLLAFKLIKAGCRQNFCLGLWDLSTSPPSFVMSFIQERMDYPNVRKRKEELAIALFKFSQMGYCHSDFLLLPKDDTKNIGANKGNAVRNEHVVLIDMNRPLRIDDVFNKPKEDNFDIYGDEWFFCLNFDLPQLNLARKFYLENNSKLSAPENREKLKRLYRDNPFIEIPKEIMDELGIPPRLDENVVSKHKMKVD